MRQAFTERVRQWFAEHPGEWIEARELETLGGRMAWRTRCSECRTKHGMTIENQQERVKDESGAVRFVRSWYRYVPARLF
jgi:hypothetical protein